MRCSRCPFTWLYRLKGRSSQPQIQSASRSAPGISTTRTASSCRTTRDGDGLGAVNRTITALHVQPKTMALITDPRHAQSSTRPNTLQMVRQRLAECCRRSPIHLEAQTSTRRHWTTATVGRSSKKKITGAGRGRVPRRGQPLVGRWCAEDRGRGERAVSHGAGASCRRRSTRPAGATAPPAGSATASCQARQTPAAGKRPAFGSTAYDESPSERARPLKKSIARNGRHTALKLAQSSCVQSEKGGMGQMVAGIGPRDQHPLAVVNNNVAVAARPFWGR